MPILYTFRGSTYHARHLRDLRKQAQKRADITQATEEILKFDSVTGKRAKILVQPKTTARNNPTNSALKGAQILGVTRNAKGVVTALKLQLRPGAKTGGGGKRSNPSAGPYTVYWREKGETRLHEGSTGASLATQKARAKSSARGGNYAELRDASGKVVAKYGGR